PVFPAIACAENLDNLSLWSATHVIQYPAMLSIDGGNLDARTNFGLDTGFLPRLASITGAEHHYSHSINLGHTNPGTVTRQEQSIHCRILRMSRGCDIFPMNSPVNGVQNSVACHCPSRCCVEHTYRL